MNIVRGAYYALISALSGAQTMALCSYDEAYTIPTEYSARISLRTMQILADEMGLAETVDPLAGSFYVETMTNQMRDKMVEIMAETDAQGGIVKLVSEGIVQAKVSAQAYKMQRDIESGAFPKVGVNRYRNEQDEEHPVEYHPYNEDDARRQIDNLNKVRAERDGDAVTQCLAQVLADAQAGVNVMPAIVAAVKAYASVGEITRQLVKAYGRYREPIRF
jgi:methylmalonyl-CoA mutase N-terminal domain/subunit